jgi:Family of unknown function (DUF6492)
MHRLGVLLKSYEGDYLHAQRMVASYRTHNVESLPLVIVVPDEDLSTFAHLVGGEVEVIGESALASHLVDEPVSGLRPGYINQEIVKLAFWELGSCANYFCADSDLVLIRDFRADDFMADESTPYTVLVEDNELKVEPAYHREHWQGRETALRRIQAEVGLVDRRLLTCHGHQVFSARVLQSLRDEFMAPRGLTYRDLLAIAPYEFSWYNFWLQRAGTIPIEVREPLVKTFHNQTQHLEYALKRITPSDIARGYLGVVVNSNFADSYDTGDIAEPPEETLARYVSPQVLARALAVQARQSMRRRLGR